MTVVRAGQVPVDSVELASLGDVEAVIILGMVCLFVVLPLALVIMLRRGKRR